MQRPAALLYGLRPAPRFTRCKHLGALPQTPRSPRGRGAGGRYASLRSTCPHAQALGHSKGIKCFRGINRAQGRYLFHGHLTPFPFKWSWCQGRKRKPQLSERSESERVSISGAAVPLMPTQRPSLWLWSWRRRERSDRLNQLPSPSAARVGRQRAQRGARGKAP